MNSICVLKIKEIGKNIMFVILNIVCFILLRYLTILMIFLIGGYASNQFIDSYWYFFPSYLLQVLVLIITNKTKNKLHYIVIGIISIFYLVSCLRLIPSVILPY